jgi:hypothetical protein
MAQCPWSLQQGNWERPISSNESCPEDLKQGKIVGSEGGKQLMKD